MINFSTNQIYLVTGANSGLGEAISQKIIELGGKVIGVARDLARLEKTKNITTHPENFIIENKDLTEDLNSISNWFTLLVEKYGKLSGLVLCAGIQNIEPLPIVRIEKAKNLFDLNYFSNIALIQAFCKKKNNIGLGSSIVAISSIAALVASSPYLNYAASKGALNSAIITLGVELAKEGIRINAISPGHVITKLMQENRIIYTEHYLEKLRQKYPLGLGKPDDIANLACFLLSDASRWITGANIVIDGGGSLVF